MRCEKRKLITFLGNYETTSHSAIFFVRRAYMVREKDESNNLGKEALRRHTQFSCILS